MAQITGQPTLRTPATASPTPPVQQNQPPATQPGLQVPGPSALGTNSSANYILGAGDQIALAVVGYPEFTGTIAVLPDGTLMLPLIGQVQAAGYTPNQLGGVLRQQLLAYLVDPVVNVGVVVQRPVLVTVAGEVHRPGPLQLSGLTSSASTLNPNEVTTAASTNSQIDSRPALPTLSAAILEAGGVTRDADIRQVMVRRQMGGGREELLTLNLWEALTSSTGTADIALRDGDAIFIPRLSADEIDRRTVASSSLAPSTIRVNVVGEVVNPGEAAVPPNSSISSAVAIAGGPTQDAQLSSVSLVRVGDSGQIEETDVDLSNLVDEYQVQEGDVIVVRKRGYLSVVDGIGRVLNPLNIFRLLGF